VSHNYDRECLDRLTFDGREADDDDRDAGRLPDERVWAESVVVVTNGDDELEVAVSGWVTSDEEVEEFR
jgi:hypothetical protein